jgi:hypothetical protein
MTKPTLENKMPKNICVTIIVMAALTISCGTTQTELDPVEKVLAEAGDNRDQLQQVLDHYATESDSLKLDAARFLIGNMAGHSYVTYYMHDTTDTEIPFDVTDYENYDSLTKAADELEKQHGLLDFSRNDPVYDVHTVTAEFLIANIDYAFRAWRERPWAAGLSYEDFRDYVLPYRGSNEPLESWRPALFDKYADVAGQLDDPTDPIQAAIAINRDIMTWFGFDSRYYYHPTDQSLAEMQASGLGRCEDMTNVTIYAMRANGIGVTSDYTPHWANTGNNHAWNAILAPNGEVIPFMGAEANPGEYHLANKLAKAYRKNFSVQPDNLTFQERKQEEVPRWLGGKTYRDVTADYVEVCQVDLTFDRAVPDSVDIAYLCVFNSGEWQAIHWGRIVAGRAVFTDMGKEIAYLPALYLNEEIVPFGAPFILHDDCTMEQLVASDDVTQDITSGSTTRRRQVASTDGIAESFLNGGKEYELFVWDDGWQSHATAVATDAPMTFEDVPAGGLYWLVEADSDHQERIFTIEERVQVWW